MTIFNDRTDYDRNKSRKFLAMSYTILNYFRMYSVLKISFIKELLIKDGFTYNPSYIDLANYENTFSLFSYNDYYGELFNKNIIFNDKILYNVIDYLLVSKGCLVRNDFVNEETDYVLLDEHLWNSTYSRSYYNLIDKTDIDKKILLISDTHIGNSDMEDFVLLNNLYLYAKNNGIKTCLHLGDLFDRNINSYFGFSRNINQFINNYPKTDIMTYSLLGNHDEIYIKYFNQNTVLRNYDFRSLSMYRKDLYMLPENSNIINFNDTDFHISHKLYYNFMLNDLKISKIKDLNNVDRLDFPNMNLNYKLFNPIYKVNISGHLHQGFIKTIDNSIYIGVPSTSKINQMRSIATMLNIHYQDKKVFLIEITPLYRNLFNEIIGGKTIYHELNKKSKTLSKTL